LERHIVTKGDGNELFPIYSEEDLFFFAPYATSVSQPVGPSLPLLSSLHGSASPRNKPSNYQRPCGLCGHLCSVIILVTACLYVREEKRIELSTRKSVGSRQRAWALGNRHEMKRSKGQRQTDANCVQSMTGKQARCVCVCARVCVRMCACVRVYVDMTAPFKS